MTQKTPAHDDLGPKPKRRRVPGAMIAMVAVVAAAIGIAAALLLQNGSSTATAAGSSSPAATAPSSAGAPSSGTQGGTSQGGSSQGLPALPALSGNGDGQIHLMLAGKVLKISGSSITIGGNGPAVTAAISRSTQVTGNVTSISGIKVGDMISTQLSGTSSASMTATAIQDPISAP